MNTTLQALKNTEATTPSSPIFLHLNLRFSLKTGNLVQNLPLEIQSELIFLQFTLSLVIQIFCYDQVHMQNAKLSKKGLLRTKRNF